MVMLSLMASPGTVSVKRVASPESDSGGFVMTLRELCWCSGLLLILQKWLPYPDATVHEKLAVSPSLIFTESGWARKYSVEG